jgi:hypothetical protein
MTSFVILHVQFSLRCFDHKLQTTIFTKQTTSCSNSGDFMQSQILRVELVPGIYYAQ